MDIIQVKEMFWEASFVKDIEKLERIFEFAGDEAPIGFLGSSIVSVGRDELGNFEFNSEHIMGDLETISTGAVLEDSVIIKQTEKHGDVVKYQIYSWDLESCSHVWIAFDNSDVMEYAYEKIKSLKDNISKSDITHKLRELEISLDEIINIKFVDGYPNDIIIDMVDESYDDVQINSDELSINLS